MTAISAILQCAGSKSATYDGSCSQREAWDRLKAYEDTGLEPEEIEKAMAISALREQEERRWIPVVERYPDTCGQYLCRAKNMIFEDSCYTEILRFERTGFYCRGTRINTVTHWIPLPEPPKEDGNDRS